MPGNYLRHVGLVSPTLDTNAVADGDIIFDTTAIPGFSPAIDQPAYLVKMIVYGQDDLTAADLRIVFLANSTSIGTPNSAPSISDANGLDVIGSILIDAASWHDLGEFKWAEVDLSKLPQAMHPKAGTTSLYFAGIAAASQTYSTSGLKFRFYTQDVFPF